MQQVHALHSPSPPWEGCLLPRPRSNQDTALRVKIMSNAARGAGWFVPESLQGEFEMLPRRSQEVRLGNQGERGLTDSSASAGI